MVQEMHLLLLLDDLLGGSLPHLSVLTLYDVAFTASPKLRVLLSSGNLASHELWDLPRSGYFSPKAHTMGLSAFYNEAAQIAHNNVQFLDLTSGM